MIKLEHGAFHLRQLGLVNFATAKCEVLWHLKSPACNCNVLSTKTAFQHSPCALFRRSSRVDTLAKFDHHFLWSISAEHFGEIRFILSWTVPKIWCVEKMCNFLGRPVCIFLPVLERCSIFNDQFPVCLFINRLRISPKTPIGLVADLSLVTCSNQNLSCCGFVDISPTLQQFLPTRRHEKTSRRKGKSPTTLVNSPNELDRLPQLRIEMTSLSATKPVGEWVDSSLS